jgi:uncharacterized membrane protein YkvA (DUF1232 family)
MNKKQPAGFDSAKRKAESLANDKSKVSSLLTEAISKADKNKGPLKKVWDDLTTLFRLIRAWVSGKYRDVPWQTIVLAIAAVVYFVNPFDLIPDFIPVIGYLDDATVVGFVIASIGSNIANFRDWEQSHS